jgi:nucleoside-diphosphate-sugar epimerase
MRVALTGSNGFTGQYVINSLVKQGIECLPIQADLTDSAALEREIADTPFDRLIHLAGQAFVGVDEWESFYNVNQLGTFRLLEAVARYRPGARCLLASSAQIYGPSAKGIVREDDPGNPANHYAISKYAMELGSALWTDRLDIVLLRPFNYTGRDQSTQYLLPKIVDHFRRRVDVIELGNVWVKRDFGDVRAVADAYTGLVLAENAPRVVNVATGREWTIGDIIAILSDLSGHKIEVRVNSELVRVGDAPTLSGDVSILRTALPDWQPRELSDTLQWMLEGR